MQLQLYSNNNTPLHTKHTFSSTPPKYHAHKRPSHTTIIPHANNNNFNNFFDTMKQSFLDSLNQNTQPDQYQGGTFVELDPNSTSSLDNSGDEGTFGPLAMLIVGFLQEEYEHVQELLLDIGADAVQVIPCSQSMLQGTLGQALTNTTNTTTTTTTTTTTATIEYEQPSLGTRRVVFLSGMYASEVIDIVGLLRESPYLPSTMAFAAAVPKSWDRNLSELIDDVYSDHAAMMKRRREMELEAASMLQEEERRNDDE